MPTRRDRDRAVGDLGCERFRLKGPTSCKLTRRGVRHPRLWSASLSVSRSTHGLFGNSLAANARTPRVPDPFRGIRHRHHRRHFAEAGAILGSGPGGLAGNDAVMTLSVRFLGLKRQAQPFPHDPAKKPRTECCCQPVAFMIAGTVVPWGRLRSAITVACLEFDRVVPR